jgi:hypothetical protein
LAAGCNKPATLSGIVSNGGFAAAPVTGCTAEQTGEVVRNHEVGTWFESGRFEPEEAVATSTREWTPESMSMEGRKGTDEQVSDSDVRQVTRTGPIPGEEVGLPTGA